MKRLRPLLVGLAILVLLDVVLRTSAFPYFPQDFRLPRTSTMGYREYLEFMRRDESVRVAVIGDSVMQGIAVDRSGTLPAQWDAIYRAQGRDVDVYNFGISAAHAEDLYPVAATIANLRAADAMVWYFNYPFYEDSTATYSGRYPELWENTGSLSPALDDPFVIAARSRETTVSAEEWTGARLADVWALFRHRDAINAALLDGTPSSWLKYHVNWQYGRFHTTPQWIKLRLDQFDEKQLTSFWRTPRFDETHVQIHYLRLALQKARAESVPMTVVWGPFNTEVVEEYGLVEPADYEHNREYVRAMAEEYGAAFVDISPGFPNELIADSVHPFAEGYGEMARRLAEQMDPAISALESAKAGER